MCVCMCAYMYVHILKKNSTTGLLAISKRKTHEISRSDNWNGFKNQAEKTLKLDANINNKQVKYEIKHTMLFTLASPQIKCMHASHSVRSTSLLPHELQPTRFLCQWNFPGKNTVVGCHFLLQGIYPSQESTHVSRVSCMNRQILYHWATWEAPKSNT